MIRLFQNLYTDKNPIRQKELDYCLTRNKNLFGGQGFIKSKVDRPTFRQLFEQINSIAEPDDISIIANSDIFFESFFDFSLIKQNEAWCLSRWEYIKGNPVLYDHADSQDVWAFRGQINEVPDCDFGLGKPGCDNAIAERIQRSGYKVLNPSKSIKSIHLHTSGIRNYSHAKDPAIEKPYLLIAPHFWNEEPVYRTIP